MDKELAKVFTTAIVKYIDSERPNDTMCCSNVECERLEKALEKNEYKYVEAFINKKLSRLTEFEEGLINFYNKRSEILPDKDGMYNRHDCEELLHESAKTLLTLAREQFIKDGYIIEKKAFHDAVEKVSPEVMKEVSDNVDKENEELTEFEQEVSDMVEYCKEHGEHVVFDYAKRHAKTLLDLAKKELSRRDEVITLGKLPPYDKGFQDGKVEALKDLPRWEDIRNFAYSWTSEDKTFYNDTLGQLFHKGKKLFIEDLEKLPGFNNN